MPRPKGARDADYAEKRAALLRLMTGRLMRRELARPSLRQLAEAAGVTLPTLRHYFGGRAEVVTAILEAYREAGEQRLKSTAEPAGSLADSVRDFARTLMFAVRHAPQARLGDLFAVSLAEGLLDPEIGPAALRFIIDPSVDALRARLDRHVQRGEMVCADTRAAALMLLSPLLIAVLHQDQMGGSATNPVDMEATVDEICRAFVRAYAAPLTMK